MTGFDKTNAETAGKKKNAVASRVIISVLLAVLLVGNTVYTVYHSIVGSMNIVSDSSTLDYTDIESLGSEDGQSEIDSVPDEIVRSTEDIEIVLLLGCDMTAGRANERSDTIMLGIIDRTHQKIKLVSLLRDCYVAIPGYKNNKLNAAFAFDAAHDRVDPTLLRSTIAKNFGVETEKFVKINFEVFTDLVDALGGVTVEVDEHEADYMCNDRVYGLFPRYSAGAGTYTMSGEEALNYVRMRRGQSDFARTERQRKLISLLMQQASDLSYLELASVVKQVLPHITTNYSEGQLLGLAFEAVTLLSYDIVQFTVPINGTWSYGEAMISGHADSVIAVNYAFNAEQLRKFIFEDDMTYTNGAEASGAMPSRLTIATTTTTTTTQKSETTLSKQEATTAAGVVEQTITTQATTTTTAAAPPEEPAS